MRYPVTIAFGTPANTTLCIINSLSIDQLPPLMIPLCLTTTSAGSCGVGAPALGAHMLALLIAALAIGGLVTLRWRRA